MHAKLPQSFLTLCNTIEVAHQASLLWDSPGKNTGLPHPSPGDLPDPGIEPVFSTSPAWAGIFFTADLPGKPLKQECSGGEDAVLPLFQWEVVSLRVPALLQYLC